jgi:hypothetical protein
VSLFKIFNQNIIMKNSIYFKALLLLLLSSSCIQDDILDDEVPETLRITASIDTLGVGDTYQFNAQYTNNIGQVENRAINWSSSDETIVSIDANGLATGLSSGTVNITAEVTAIDQSPLSEVFELVVDQETISSGPETRSGNIAATSFYTLTGDFTISETDSGLIIEFEDNYEADRALPGLYVYLTNNPNSINAHWKLVL